MLGAHHHRPFVDDGFEEMHRLRRHRPRVRVLHELPGHRRHGQPQAVLDRLQHDVAVRIVHDDRAVGADDLDPRRGKVGIAWRIAPGSSGQALVASIAAGESLIRPLIFLPRPRVMWRLTSALTGRPITPRRMDCQTYANFGLIRCE